MSQCVCLWLPLEIPPAATMVNSKLRALQNCAPRTPQPKEVWEAATLYFNGEMSFVMAGKEMDDAAAHAWALWARCKADALRGSPRLPLRSADFSNNRLTGRGLLCIVDVLVTEWPELSILKAFNNAIETSAAAVLLLRLGNLTQMHLSHNALTVPVIFEIVEAATKANYPKAAKPLWLRLEHNVPDGDIVLAKLLAPLGALICMVDGTSTCNPCCCSRRITPAVHLTYIGTSRGGKAATKMLVKTTSAMLQLAPAIRPVSGARMPPRRVPATDAQARQDLALPHTAARLPCCWETPLLQKLKQPLPAMTMSCDDEAEFPPLRWPTCPLQRWIPLLKSG